MKTAGCLREFVRYALLNVLGMMGLSCYILADTFFIAQGLGANGLTALNLAIPVYSFIHGSGLMMGIGGATKYALLRGQRAAGEANALYVNTLYLAAGLAAAFTLAGGLFSGPLTGLLGAGPQVFAMTQTYLRVLLLFSPAFMINDIVICFVRNDGDPRLSMLAMVGGSLSNILLDYVFIFPLRMGMFGAVLATGLAPLISLLILSGHWRRGRNGFGLCRAPFRARLARPVLSLGLPSLIAEVASGVVMVVFNALLLRLRGNVGVAAYGVVANLSLVVWAVYTGVAQGMQPLVSRACGRRDGAEARQVLNYAAVSVLGLSGAVYLAVYGLAGPIARIFNSEESVQLQEIAVHGLRLYFTAAPFAGLNIVLSLFFTSAGRARPAHLISLLRGLVVIVPMALALARLAGLTGVWLALPATECLVALVGLALYRRTPHTGLDGGAAVG